MTQLILNFQNDSEATGGMMTSSSQVASHNHANHTQAQVSALGKRTNAIYGRRCLEQYEKLSQPTLWAKMFVACLIGMEGWYSTKCVLTWKILAIKLRPVLYLRAVSVRHTAENEYGLLPTPSVMQMDYQPREGWVWMGNYWIDEFGKKRQTDLTSSIRMLPTPSVSDTQGSPKRPETITQNKTGGWTRTADGKGTKFGAKLMDVAGLLPKPTAMDSNGATANMKSSQVKEGSMHSVTLSRLLCTPTAQASRGNTSDKRGKGNLTDQIAEMELTFGKTSQLNPRFVAEMMGFSPTHTLRPFQKKETTWTEI